MKFKPKRTMAKGLRPLPYQPLKPPADISARNIEKMKRVLFDEVLADGKKRKDLDQRQLFVVDHALLVVQFHQGEKTAADVFADEERGHKVSFDQEDISSLNFILLEQKANGQLASIFEKLRERSQK